jgi:hypothetical protein
MCHKGRLKQFGNFSSNVKNWAIIKRNTKNSKNKIKSSCIKKLMSVVKRDNYMYSSNNNIFETLYKKNIYTNTWLMLWFSRYDSNQQSMHFTSLHTNKQHNTMFH